MSTSSIHSQAVPVSELESELCRIEKQIETLNVQRKTIYTLIERYAKPYAVEPNTEEGLRLAGPGVREGIANLLDEQPGLTATVVAETLENQVASRAKDKKNVIRTTLAKMVNEGVVQRSSDGKHSLTGGDE
ncbi:MAG: hypothetical protein JKY96_07715 [Phycisphaerales bacterium]|nr:hypothetical protein [Phycisphaerales bacterium]